MRWNKRKHNCAYCKLEMDIGQAIVVCQWWSSKRKWMHHAYYHPRCWIHQGFDYLRAHPYVYTPRKGVGRPKLMIDGDGRRARQLLLMRGASIRQRKRQYIQRLPDAVAEEKLLTLDDQLIKVGIELEACGGKPKKW